MFYIIIVIYHALTLFAEYFSTIGVDLVWSEFLAIFSAVIFTAVCPEAACFEVVLVTKDEVPFPLKSPHENFNWKLGVLRSKFNAECSADVHF